LTETDTQRAALDENTKAMLHPKKGKGFVVEPSKKINVYTDNSKASATAAARDSASGDASAAALAKIARRRTQG
jgi:hypothetical protein